MDDRLEHGEQSWSGKRVSAVQCGSIAVNSRDRLDDEEIAIRAFADRSPLGIIVTCGEDLVTRYVNPAFRRLVGAEDQVVLGRPFVKALHSPHARRMVALLRRVNRTGRARCEVEMRLRGVGAAGGSGDGESRNGGSGAAGYWRLTAWPLPDEGDQPKGLVLQVRDVTEERSGRRRRTETITEMREINQRLLVASLREQELTEKAEAANEAKSAFLATMSHELRTPLTAILGYQELLADGLSGPVTDRQRKHLARIKLSATHLLMLIEGILTLSRLDANRETVLREPVAVNCLLDEAVTLVAPLAASKHFELIVQEPASPLVVETDHHKVRQILVNLLGNAVKFTDHGAVILGARAEQGSVIFTVRDSGVGIRPEHLERVFDPFWQVEQTKTRTVGGSGLGLNVSRRLARLLGGDLTVESTVGVGSEFALRLPLSS